MAQTCNPSHWKAQINRLGGDLKKFTKKYSTIKLKSSHSAVVNKKKLTSTTGAKQTNKVKDRKPTKSPKNSKKNPKSHSNNKKNKAHKIKFTTAITNTRKPTKPLKTMMIQKPPVFKLISATTNTNAITLRDPRKAMYAMYKTLVIDAYRDKQIFQIYGGYGSLRRALCSRGWIEKLAPGRFVNIQKLSMDNILQQAKKGNDFELVAISKIINHFPAFFIWQGKYTTDMNQDVRPYRNRIRRSRPLDFSTKVGFIGCAESAEHWFRQESVCGMRYPRFYRLGECPEDQQPFVEDFRLTQCCSLLRYVIHNLYKPNMLYDEEEGKVETYIINFALARINDALNDLDNTTLDDYISDNVKEKEGDWKRFMTNSTMILNGTGRFQSNDANMKELARVSKHFLDNIEEHRPDYRWDGFRNLWILKPGYSSRGKGIILRNDLDYILSFCSNNSLRRYIVQKYIERPLLIFNTKFDIRQYMLVQIGVETIRIWLYRDCYLRFSSQQYSTDDLRESIHLTNNSVQKHYRNERTRDIRLPICNMWTLEQFKKFMKYNQIIEDIWENQIYAGFRENLIAVVMASTDETNFVENAFELYGCDFMLDEYYKPILIEINSSPDLTSSTEVTARMCPNVLEDLVKVIVDFQRKPGVSTGLFELVYEVNYKTKRVVDSLNGLSVVGNHISLN